MTESKAIHGVVVGEQASLSLAELCRICGVHAEYIIDLVSEGAIDPEGEEPSSWLFSCVSLQRTQAALRLQRDLDINLQGVALILDLLEEIRSLRLATQAY